MTVNPIIVAVAEAVSAAGHLMSSVAVAAPLGYGPATLAINLAAWRDGAAPATPHGVTARALEREPVEVLPLPAMAGLEHACIDAAWAHGAWDIARTVYRPGYDGPLPPGLAPIEREARAQGYVEWRWRPMMLAPETRAKAHAHRDATLDRWSLGRATPPPAIRVPPLEPGRARILVLGVDPERRVGRGGRQAWRRATRRQRDYLHWLDPHGPPLDATVSRAEASARITAALAARNTAPPAAEAGVALDGLLCRPVNINDLVYFRWEADERWYRVPRGGWAERVLVADIAPAQVFLWQRNGLVAERIVSNRWGLPEREG